MAGSGKRRTGAGNRTFQCGFCHKGGFLMMTGTLEDAVAACKISLSCFKEEPVIVNLGGGKEADVLLQKPAGNGACPYFALCAARSSGAYNAGNLWGSCNGKAAVEESELLQSSVTLLVRRRWGHTATNNLLGHVSVNSITQACMSFTSQNFSVGKYKRMDRVLMDCLICL